MFIMISTNCTNRPILQPLGGVTQYINGINPGDDNGINPGNYLQSHTIVHSGACRSLVQTGALPHTAEW